MKIYLYFCLLSLSISSVFAAPLSPLQENDDDLYPTKNSPQYQCKILQNIEYKALHERFYLGFSYEKSSQDSVLKMNEYYDTTEFSEAHRTEFRQQISDIVQLITAAVFKRPTPKLSDDLGEIPEKFEPAGYQICMAHFAANTSLTMPES